MIATTTQTSAPLICHVCGYDLRVHALEAACPECGTPVADVLAATKVPARPPWHLSDPRWRRNLLLGLWLLTLFPLVALLRREGWAELIPVPSVAGLAVYHLDDSLLCYGDVYKTFIFSSAAALLLTRERGRRHTRLDWTRRWGGIMNAVGLILGAAQFFFIFSLVAVGLGALFQSIAPRYCPPGLTIFADVGYYGTRYGPHPGGVTPALYALVSALTVLAVCVRLFNALTSTGRRKRTALLLLSPLAFAVVTHVAAASWFLADCLIRTLSAPAKYINIATPAVANVDLFFRPEPVVSLLPTPIAQQASIIWPPQAVIFESVKYLLFVCLAVYFTAVTFKRRKADP